MEKLWQPGRIGSMTTRNRTMRSATNEHLATRQGVLTEAWREHMAQLARGGVGVIITGQFSMDLNQRGDEGQPALMAEMGEESLRRSRDILRRACEEVHRENSRLVVQLSHAGPKGLASVNGREPMFPGDFSPKELEKLVEAFVFGARFCRDCGADGVQIHMAHGYLLSSFLNPEQNARQDAYGGSLENRFRLPGEIIRAVRQACGAQFPVLVKVDSNGSGDLNGLLRLCEAAGVDCAEVSGLDFAARKRAGEPFYLETLLGAREGVEMPLALVGGIHTVESARAVMEAGIEFASLSRPLIREPDLIGRMERGEQTEGTCIACNGCFRVFRQRPVRCVFHTEEIPQLEEVFGPYPEK